MKKISFIIHGNCKKKERLKTDLKKTFEGKNELAFYVTQFAGAATSLAQQAIREGADYVIGVGGDGTLNEMVNGIMELPPKERQHLVAGLLPAGTGNDTARTLGLHAKPESLLHLVESGNTVELNLVKATFTSSVNEQTTRYFVNITDLGIGGEAVQRVANSSRFSKWLLGSQLSYVKAVLLSFFKYHRPKAQLMIPNKEMWEGSVLSLVIANCKYFGGGLCIAPEADPCDGQLQLITLSQIGVWDCIRNMGKVNRGERMDHPQVMYQTAPSCKVRGVEGEELAIDMDGEFVGYTPIQVEVVPHAISFLADL